MTHPAKTETRWWAALVMRLAGCTHRYLPATPASGLLRVRCVYCRRTFPW